MPQWADNWMRQIFTGLFPEQAYLRNSMTMPLPTGGLVMAEGDLFEWSHPARLGFQVGTYLVRLFTASTNAGGGVANFKCEFWYVRHNRAIPVAPEATAQVSVSFPAVDRFVQRSGWMKPAVMPRSDDAVQVRLTRIAGTYAGDVAVKAVEVYFEASAHTPSEG